MTEAKAKFEPSASDYALTTHAVAEAQAPELPYLPPMPKDRSTGIALVGAGGISAAHLDAYRAYGLNVLLICSRDLGRARARRDAFFPKADATDDFEKAIGDPRIKVVDFTTESTPSLDRNYLAHAARSHCGEAKPERGEIAPRRVHRLAAFLDCTQEFAHRPWLCTQLTPSSAERARREHRHPKASTPEVPPALDPLETSIRRLRPSGVRKQRSFAEVAERIDRPCADCGFELPMAARRCAASSTAFSTSTSAQG